VPATPRTSPRHPLTASLRIHHIRYRELRGPQPGKLDPAICLPRVRRATPTSSWPLPINDDEFIDRVLAIQALAGRRVTLLTYDTGQSTRARAAGLRARKLTQPEKGEPGKLGGARKVCRSGSALSLYDSELVAQHRDPGGLPCLRTLRQPRPPGQAVRSRVRVMLRLCRYESVHYPFPSPFAIRLYRHRFSAALSQREAFATTGVAFSSDGKVRPRAPLADFPAARTAHPQWA
jgi:hypothetical protein